jgi:hypothetical protein
MNKFQIKGVAMLSSMTNFKALSLFKFKAFSLSLSLSLLLALFLSFSLIGCGGDGEGSPGDNDDYGGISDTVNATEPVYPPKGPDGEPVEDYIVWWQPSQFERIQDFKKYNQLIEMTNGYANFDFTIDYGNDFPFVHSTTFTLPVEDIGVGEASKTGILCVFEYLGNTYQFFPTIGSENPGVITNIEQMGFRSIFNGPESYVGFSIWIYDREPDYEGAPEVGVYIYFSLDNSYTSPGEVPPLNIKIENMRFYKQSLDGE